MKLLTFVRVYNNEPVVIVPDKIVSFYPWNRTNQTLIFLSNGESYLVQENLEQVTAEVVFALGLHAEVK